MSYIEFKNVNKEYKMGEITIKALDDTNFSIEKGELVVIVGPSGAGKTTTIKIVSGLLLPDKGTVEIDGIDALAYPRQMREKIGYVPDYFGVYDNLKVCWKI